jgi:hypothetical protein
MIEQLRFGTVGARNAAHVATCLCSWSPPSRSCRRTVFVSLVVDWGRPSGNQPVTAVAAAFIVGNKPVDQ